MFKERVVYDSSRANPPSPASIPTETERRTPGLSSWLASIWSQMLHQPLVQNNLQTESTPKKEVEQDEALLEIFNFLLREILPLPEPQKIRLLKHYLGAIAREAHQASSHLAYTIDFDELGNINLTDPIYQKNKEVVAVCQASIEKASSQLAKSRYLLELKQIERLIAALKQTTPFNTGAPQLLQEVEELSEAALSKTFEAIGWKRASNSIMPELDNMMPELDGQPNLNSPSANCWVGQKSLYLMPESKIHPGGFTVVVLVQPAFLPEENRWALLQSQYMIQLSQADLIQLLQKLGQNISPTKNAAFDEIEQKTMSLLISLGSEAQLLSAEEVFLNLLEEFETRNQVQKLKKATQVNQLRLKNYAHYLIKIFKLENYEQGLSSKQTERLILGIKRVVLAGIFDLNNIGDAEVERLVEHYQHFSTKQQKPHPKRRQLFGPLEAVFATSLAETATFASATKAFNPSLIECLTMSPFSAITAQGQRLGTNSSISPGGLWGKLEGRGCITCPACGQKSITPFICSNCGYVRGAPLPKPYNQTISNSQSHKPALPTPTTSKHQRQNKRTIGLGAFVAGLDKTTPLPQDTTPEG
ncbi:MAG: hypothetical protein U9O78_03840 [Patescibacteria group bacterium]|nr:hypothetical protein [Patescibacteria group bacterium]